MIDPTKQYTLAEFCKWAVDLGHLNPDSLRRFAEDFAKGWTVEHPAQATLSEWIDTMERWIKRT